MRDPFTMRYPFNIITLGIYCYYKTIYEAVFVSRFTTYKYKKYIFAAHQHVAFYYSHFRASVANSPLTLRPRQTLFRIYLTDKIAQDAVMLCFLGSS